MGMPAKDGQIRCDMDEDGPPCKRCKERNMPCKLNKSLQTLIEEESKLVPGSQLGKLVRSD